MNGDQTFLWTLEALTARVAMALATGYEGQRNGQVSDVPNGRTIRYYTTLGLVDRPAAFEGRTALYGPRHLTQVVAIKRLQAAGASLTEVQERLTAASEADLRDWARLPEAALEEASTPAAAPALQGAAGEATADAPARPPASRRTFWMSEPAEVDAAAQIEPAPHQAPEGLAAPDPTAGLAASAGSRWLVGRPLAPGLVLLLEPGRSPNDDDWRAVEEAAAPLLKLLRQRGLLSPAFGRTES